MDISEILAIGENKLRVNRIRADRASIIPFVGAGISKQCGLYLWKELLSKIASDYISEPEFDRLLAEASDFEELADKISEISKNSTLLTRKMCEVVGESHFTSLQIPKMIVKAFPGLAITTNYDIALEKASIELNMPYKVLLPTSIGQVSEAMQLNKRCLIKLHGSVEEHSSIILTRKQYDAHYGKRDGLESNIDSLSLPQELKTLFLGHVLLFVGCSIVSDRTLDILKYSVEKNQNITNYAILPEPKPEEIKTRNIYLNELGILPIYYPVIQDGETENHSALLTLLEYICDESLSIDSNDNVTNDIVSNSYEERNDVVETTESYIRNLGKLRVIIPGLDTFMVSQKLSEMPRTGKLKRLKKFQEKNQTFINADTIKARTIYDHICSLAYLADDVTNYIGGALYESIDTSDISLLIACHELGKVIYGDIPTFTDIEPQSEQEEFWLRIKNIDRIKRDKIACSFLWLFADTEEQKISLDRYISFLDGINPDVMAFFRCIDALESLFAIWRYMFIYRSLFRTGKKLPESFIDIMEDFYFFPKSETGKYKLMSRINDHCPYFMPLYNAICLVLANKSNAKKYLSNSEITIKMLVDTSLRRSKYFKSDSDRNKITGLFVKLIEKTPLFFE